MPNCGNITDFVRRQVVLVEVAAAPVHASLVRLPDPGDGFQQCAFSAPGRPDDGMQTAMGKPRVDRAKKPLLVLPRPLGREIPHRAIPTSRWIVLRLR